MDHFDTDEALAHVREIGRIRTPFDKPEGSPIQSVFAGDAAGQIVLKPEYTDALDDVDGFERVWLLYWMDRAAGFRPKVVPFRDDQERGLFATRAPCRPNPIGLSAVRVIRREGSVLHVADVDMLDNTPLLDLKPYVPKFDAFPSARAGWFETGASSRTSADARFCPGVTLTLDGVCIETAAKAAHRELVCALLEQSEPSDRQKNQLALLETFLAQTDFAALRASQPDLAHGKGLQVRLLLAPDGGPRWERL